MAKQTIAVFIEIDGDSAVNAVQDDAVHITQTLKSFMVTAVRRGTKLEHGEAYAAIRVKDRFSVYNSETGAWM